MDRPHKYYLLVDGYNIINSWEELTRAAQISLETARTKLVEIMENYAAHTGAKVLVVFDAHMVEGRQRYIYSTGDVDVVFTKEWETADHYIEKVVDAIGRDQKVLVATSDWIEQQIVMGRGAQRISARELREEICQLVEIQRKREKKQEKDRDTLGDIIDPMVRKMLEGDIEDNG
jgi:predicted RNA-binding protein with PIN domain